MNNPVIRLLESIGEISDYYIIEAESTFPGSASYGRALKFGAIGLAASFGFAAAVWIYRAKRGSGRVISAKAS